MNLDNQFSNDGGLTDDEFNDFIDSASGLRRRLEGARVRNFHADVSCKDRETPSQTVTLEVWIDDMPRMVAQSQDTEIKRAFADVSRKMLRQVNEGKDARVRRREQPFRNNTISMPIIDPEAIV